MRLINLLIFSSLSLGLLQYLQAEIKLTDLPPISTVQQSQMQLENRKSVIINEFANENLTSAPVWPKVGFREFATSMISRLYLKKDLSEINQNILDANFQPWLTGTDFQIGNCERKGDYDFVLQPLLRIAYLDIAANKTLLSDATRDKLYHVLLSEKGVDHHYQVSIGGCITVTDTENHILMTEVARYLTNQILYTESVLNKAPDSSLDNSQNGFDSWMLNHLADFLKQDFSEFNSRPYAGYTQIALENLYEHSQSKKVKTMAQMVLDYLSAKYAVSENGMRRLVPFRRQKAKLNANRLLDYDNAAFANIFLAGNYFYMPYENDTTLFPDGEGSYEALMAATGSYHLPQVVLDIAIDKSASYFQTIRHTDVEMYSSSASFLLSSGGRWRAVPGFGSSENNAWGVATSVIPTQGEAELKNLFYILGDKQVSKRNNLCFAKNFACGFNVHIPENIATDCVVTHNNWRFIDMQKCKGYNFFVAINSHTPDTNIDSVNDDYSTLEVQEASILFADFMKNVMDSNPEENFRNNQMSHYQTQSGDSIDFTFYNPDLANSPIYAINGAKLESHVLLWPRAQGDIMNSLVPGLIEIKRNGSSLVLDARDPQNPVRIEFKKSQFFY